MQAVGLYSGVPQYGAPLPQNPPKKHYLPNSIKTVTLLGFCVLTASIIGVLQWTAAPGNQRNSPDLRRRDDAPTITYYPRAIAGRDSTVSDPGSIATIPSTSDGDNVSATTNPDAFIPITPTTTIAVGTTNTDAFIPMDPTSAEYTAPSAFVPLDPNDGGVAESTASSAFIPINPTPTAAFTTAPGAYVPLGPSGTPVTTPTAGTFVITTNIPGGTMLVAATITGTLDPSQPLLFTATGADIPGGTLVITKTGPLLAGPTTVAQGSSPSSSSTFGDAPADSFGAADDGAGAGFTLAHYFMGAYLPTLLAVVYGVLWSAILAGIAEMTPFFQLTRPGGATVKESLLLEYENAGLWELLVGSVRHRDGLVFAGTVVSLILTATIALASGVFYIGVSGTCRETGRGADCVRYLGVNRRLAWAECGMLVVVLGIMAFVIFSVRKRSSGLFAEATSIAGVATLMGNPHVVARMREALEREKDGRSGSEARFGIGQSYSQAVGWTHGFTVLDEAKREKDAPAPIFAEHDTAREESGSVLPLLLRPAMLVVFQLVLLGLLAILVYYWFNGSSSPLEDFLNSQTFGPKLMMSCFGIVIRTWWSEIARAIHTMQPYRALALGRATAHATLLAPTSSHAIPAIITALRRRHLFAAWLALLAVLGEVLIVTLSAVPFNLTTLLDAFKLSMFVSMGIVGLMVATLPFVFVWCRTAVVGPPECVADTVAVLMGEGGGEVVAALAGMGRLGRWERDRAVRGLGRRFRLVEEGWGRGGGKAGRMGVAFERDGWVG